MERIDSGEGYWVALLLGIPTCGLCVIASGEDWARVKDDGAEDWVAMQVHHFNGSTACGKVLACPECIREWMGLDPFDPVARERLTNGIRTCQECDDNGRCPYQAEGDTCDTCNGSGVVEVCGINCGQELRATV